MLLIRIFYFLIPNLSWSSQRIMKCIFHLVQLSAKLNFFFFFDTAIRFWFDRLIASWNIFFSYPILVFFCSCSQQIMKWYFSSCSITTKLQLVVSRREKNVLSFNFSSMVTRSIDSILKMVHVMTKNFTDHRVLRIFSSVTSVSYLLREMAGGGERVFSLQKIANCLVNRVKTVKQHNF